MIHLDLFSGIGGFSLAAQWVWKEEHHVHCFVENDPFCQKVLKKHWPNTPIHDDIRTYKHDETAITLLTGGFPCQAFSVAGKRKGKADDRYLWPEMFKIITKVSPTWVIGENVPGIINMELNQVLSDLEGQGYEAQPLIIPACAVDAPHRRDRVWIVAYNNTIRCNVRGSEGKGIYRQEQACDEADSGSEDMANAKKQFSNGSDNNGRSRSKQISKSGNSNQEGRAERSRWISEPDVDRVAHGFPRGVDRLRSLGNAIVPQVVMPIMQAIKEIEDNLTP